MQCQVCLEECDAPLVTSLCCRSCPAQVCAHCLARHVDVSLDQFYPGVLPLIRCPICLVPIHISRWTDKIDTSSLSTDKPSVWIRYQTLCEQACALTPPCCHRENYTHLPEEKTDYTTTNTLMLLPSQVSAFRQLVRRFCRHKVDARAVLDYALTTFGDEKSAELLKRTFPRITDAERRARLLLAYMYLRPKTKTWCCEYNICFNCKRIGHHDKCSEFEAAVDEEQCLVRCRSCRVMLMKVEGCDSVACVCGFVMSWPSEIELRSLDKKNALPVDIFDTAAVNMWRRTRELVGEMLNEMVHKAEELRRKQAVQWAKDHGHLLRPAVVDRIWRLRFNKAMSTMTNEFNHKHGGFIDGSIAHFRWHQRHSDEMIAIKSEIYWKTYHLINPQELVELNEELDAFLAVDVC